jgi:hypothetical protein
LIPADDQQNQNARVGDQREEIKSAELVGKGQDDIDRHNYHRQKLELLCDLPAWSRSY